jgi:hypothetical protein
MKLRINQLSKVIAIRLSIDKWKELKKEQAG